MRQRSIGGVAVSAIGLGAMPLSVTPERPSEPDAIRGVHAALDAGVRLIDVADAYCLDATEIGHNERLIAKALESWSGDAGEVLVATKGGHVRDRAGGWSLNGTPSYLRTACERSLRALDVDAIGLYQLHRPDPETPWAESVGTLFELQREGKVRLVGVSNANAAQIDEALALGPLAAVQNELSPRYRESLGEVRHCAQRGVAFLPWSPLGGATSGPFAEVARERGVSPQQVTLAWELAQAGNVIPIPGSTRPATIRDSAAAAELVLTDEELGRLQAPTSS
jgi:aryl-alcohol dehydrogenase-like predicted oxidoreductase